MIPTPKDLVLTRGDYFEMFFRFRTQVWDPTGGDDGEGAYVDGPYRDLTGITWLGQIRSEVDSTILATFHFQTFDQTDDDTKGAVLVYLTGDDAAALPIGKWKYDLQRTLDAKPETFIGGKVTVKGDISKPVTP